MIAVLGEALVDLTPREQSDPPPEGAARPGPWPTYVARPGGSPLNVAVGLARLGVPTRFLGRLSTDVLGRRLQEHLAAEGVGTGATPAGPEPTAVALVSLDADGQATYRFLWDGTADRALTTAELPDDLGEAEALHVGSLGALLPPGAAAVRALVDRERDARLVSYDPNVRPGLLADADAARRRVDELAAASHLVRASEQDLAWLDPDRPPRAVASGWLDAGPTLVVVTRGGAGAVALAGHTTVEVPAPSVPVADTVGAGDALTAGLLAWLAARDRLSPPALAGLNRRELEAGLGFAVAVAADTVTRRGADPPRWPVAGP